MRARDIRARYLQFFADKGHTVVPSSPVVPHDDPTLLFANAGMNQFKSVFTGDEQRDYNRAASSQKCVRAGGKHNDLENVGYTARHLTFFEMLGNFSFGDYFKKEACAWAWELVTEHFGLDPQRLWISVFHEDDEARAIWRDEVGVSNDRIVGLGEKDNYWSMGDVGPCGPCSEIHFDRGADASCGPNCELGVCDCDRYLEFWNLVFMQFEKKADGSKIELPRPSIDTGMGLERMALILQGVDSVYEVDLLEGIVDEIARITGVPSSPGPEGTPHRVIADHVRSLSFAIADGAFPSNEARGYVLRRILRRAARYGYKLGMEQPFIYQVVDHLALEMGEAFPELVQQKDLVKKLLHSEEEQFGRTLRTGMVRFEDEVAAMRDRSERVFPAQTAFFLHDTCGFPIDLTEQMAREIDLDVDKSGYAKLMEEQKQRSRASTDFSVSSEGGSQVQIQVSPDTPRTEFVGYCLNECDTEILLASEDAQQLILRATPFYAESGGQVADTGSIRGDGFVVRVIDTKKTPEGVFLHRTELIEGDAAALQAAVQSKTPVHAAIDSERRSHIVRNHTATHLLHAALRQVLGTHVQQKGSLVSPERLRFDVSHFQKVELAELEEVEAIVQQQVMADTEVVIEDGVSKDEATARGAMALFGEKYGDKVRVVEIPGFSVELCGGIHCQRTGEIGSFVLLGEGSVSSGVRRVEALTGVGSMQRTREDEDLLRDLSGLLKSKREDLLERIEGLLNENKELRSGNKKQQTGDLLKELDAGAGERAQVGNVELVTASWSDAPMEELMRVGDALKRRDGDRVYILTTTSDESGVRFVIGTSQSIPKGKVHCGKIAGAGAKVLGGGGGGRPDMAQAGGKDASKLAEAVKVMRDSVADALAR